MAIQNVSDPLVLVQTAGDTYNGSSANQTYIINQNAIQAGDTIIIVDQGGTNSIELPAGLQIASSQVVGTQAILTLSNGAVIDIRGADTFTYKVGQSILGGDTVGTDLSYTDFAQNILGVTVPATGEPVATGGVSTVNDDGTADGGSGTGDFTTINGTPNDDQFDDQLFGTDQDDRFFALAGQDWIRASFGNDTIDGGDGFDLIFYDFADLINGVTVNNTDTSINGIAPFTADKRGFGEDTLISIENFHGTHFDDEIYVGGFGQTYTFDEAGDDLVVASQAPDAHGHTFFTGSGSDTLVGSVGEDWLSYSSGDIVTPTQGVDVDLAAGSGTDAWGDTDTFSSIENVSGTDFDDTITGDSSDNFLEGFGGNDTLTGNGGADVLRGGDGDDVLTAGEENSFGDFSGGDGNDSITVIAGNAFIQPGAGDDTITGSSGENDFNDIVYIYDARNATPTPTNGIVVVYSGEGAGTVTDYAGGIDIFTNIDIIRGTQLADSFTGSDGRDSFTGLDGDDTFDGGEGYDRVDYWWSQFADGAAGVTVDLTTGTATDPFGDTDTLISIEEIQGTVFDDVMFGATGAESGLSGDDGNDSLTGADDDFETGLSGGAGNDTLDGGSGGAYFAPGSGNDIIIGGTEEEGFYSIEYIWDADRDGATNGIVVIFNSERGGTVTDYADGTDTFTGIDRVQGTMLADSFIGTDGDQDFRGYGGDDVFDGGAGDRDRVDYSRARAEFGDVGGVVVDLTAGTATDPYGDTDTLISIERIRGTNFDDIMFGATGVESQLDGGDGNDSLTGADDDFFTDLIGGGGDDTLDGGTGGAFFEPETGTDIIIGGTADEGFFALSYIFDSQDAGATSGITVQFSSERDGTVVDYNGDTDTFQGIDRVRGTNNDDSFTGAEGRQEFRGFGGDDFFDGDAGDNDRIDYARDDESLGAFQGIVVDMIAGTATDTYGDTDTFVNIEDIRGSKFDDIVNGDGQNNSLEGEGGNDTLSGGEGADYLVGGEGNDTFAFQPGDSFYGIEAPMIDGIADFQLGDAGSGYDVLDFDGPAGFVSSSSDIDVSNQADNSTDTTEIFATVVNGILGISGADAQDIDTLNEYLAVVDSIHGTAPSNLLYLFEFGGDTFAVKYYESGIRDVVVLDGLSGVQAISFNTADAASDTLIFM